MAKAAQRKRTISISGVRRFWSKVRKTKGCWLWKTGKNTDGYGVFYLNGYQEKAHKASWLIKYNDSALDYLVLHKCDTVACVRPSHLFLGTDLDNHLDSMRKNRNARGTMVGSAKINYQIAQKIRKEFKAGIIQAELGREYHLTEGQISNIVHNRNWITK